MEFLGAVGNFLKQAQPAVQMMPDLAPMAGEMLSFLVRGFRAGRQLEDVIDQTMKQITEKQQNPPPPPPDPEMQKVQAQIQADQQTKQQDLQFNAQKHAQDMQFNQEKHQAEMAMKAHELDANMRQKEADRVMQMQQHQETLASQRESQQNEISARMGEGEMTRNFERDKMQMDTRESFIQQSTQAMADALRG